MESKPSVLYRGIKIDYNKLQSFNFEGIDLVVNYPPIIDKYGRKTVIDGNEYGVYMSDNLSMVESAYGNLHRDGISVHKNLSINYERIMIPSIGVIYQINTDGLDIREPFISDQLKGHYNNGYQGKEWIADIVPSSNYSLYRVRIGSDILHPAQDVDLSKVENVSEFLKQQLEMRKYRLEMFANVIERVPVSKRNNIGATEMKILKSIYGENGVKYINEESLDTTNVNEMITYLSAKFFKQHESNIDFQTLKYIDELRERVTDIDSIIETIKNDKIKNMQNKVAFEQRKKQEGVPFSTSSFDKQEKRLDTLMSIVLLRKKKDNQYNQEQMKSHNFVDHPVKSFKLNSNKQKEEEIQFREENFRKIFMEKYGLESDFELDRMLEQQAMLERQLQEMENVENVEQFGRKMR